MLHRMRLHAQPFAAIKSGRKTVELRLYDEKRRKIKVGDVIRFDLTDGNDSLMAQVINLYPFPSFQALYQRLPLEQCGYEDASLADPRDMEKYYSEEEQKAFGVVGIEVRVLCKT